MGFALSCWIKPRNGSVRYLLRYHHALMTWNFSSFLLPIYLLAPLSIWLGKWLIYPYIVFSTLIFIIFPCIINVNSLSLLNIKIFFSFLQIHIYINQKSIQDMSSLWTLKACFGSQSKLFDHLFIVSSLCFLSWAISLLF